LSLSIEAHELTTASRPSRTKTQRPWNARFGLHWAVPLVVREIIRGSHHTVSIMNVAAARAIESPGDQRVAIHRLTMWQEQRVDFFLAAGLVPICG
jgi:hypothetical protein